MCVCAWPIGIEIFASATNLLHSNWMKIYYTSIYEQLIINNLDSDMAMGFLTTKVFTCFFSSWSFSRFFFSSTKKTCFFSVNYPKWWWWWQCLLSFTNNLLEMFTENVLFFWKLTTWWTWTTTISSEFLQILFLKKSKKVLKNFHPYTINDSFNHDHNADQIL